MTAEMEHEDAEISEANLDMSNNSPDNKPTEQQITGDSAADDSVKSPLSQRRPKGSKNQGSEEDVPMTAHSTRKRGRPKKSLQKSATEDLQKGSSDAPKTPKGSPKGSQKSLTSGEENESSSVTPTKRGRPKGSLHKVSKLESELAREWVSEAVRSVNSLKRGRVRHPRQVEVNNTGPSTQDRSNGYEQGLVSVVSPPIKRGSGRPKDALNNKHPKLSRAWMVHVPRTKKNRRGPTTQPGKQGRPRKYSISA
ncbi:high mobility group protein hmg-12-like [Antennarius striatus]|uniref:high mobility group protein hmg-12-like n=1 Tax=Antennarius striatus TaxID=241820 RepID=UPI0035B2413A